jgi:hypothetical protein
MPLGLYSENSVVSVQHELRILHRYSGCIISVQHELRILHRYIGCIISVQCFCKLNVTHDLNHGPLDYTR